MESHTVNNLSQNFYENFNHIPFIENQMACQKGNSLRTRTSIKSSETQVVLGGFSKRIELLSFFGVTQHSESIYWIYQFTSKLQKVKHSKVNDYDGTQTTQLINVGVFQFCSPFIVKDSNYRTYNQLLLSRNLYTCDCFREGFQFLE